MKKIIIILGILVSNQIFAQTFGEYYEYIYAAEHNLLNGNAEIAAESYDKAFETGLMKQRDLYLAASNWAKLNVEKKAFEYLIHAIETGYMDKAWLQNDTAFNKFHESKIWWMSLALIDQKMTDLDTNLRQQLNDMLSADQKHRGTIDSLSELFGWESETVQTAWANQKAIDEANLLSLEGIFEVYNYPGKSVAGDLSDVAYYILQRADLETQQKYFPLLKQAVIEGEFSMTKLANFVDRMKVQEERKQVFGTQIIRNPKSAAYEFYPIHDPDLVNQRREEAQLPPIEYEAKFWGIEILP